MSVEISSYSSRRISDTAEERMSPVTTVKYATREYASGIDFEIRPVRISAPPTRRAASEKVVRRLQGFLVQDEGEEYKVAFINEDKPVFYRLPAAQLRSAGITAENQPFQMDEVEIELQNGRLMTGYTFVPLARPSDAFNDSIDLDKNERRSKLSAIFKRFGKAQD